MCLNRLWIWTLALPLLLACSRYREDLDYAYAVEYSWEEPHIGGEFALFEGVAWDAGISQSIRPILEESVVGNRKVLDLFSGPGVIAVICGDEGAARVVSLAETEAAEACTRYNVAAHGLDSTVTVKKLDNQSPSLTAGERFDVIVANLAGDASDRFSREIKVLLECVTGHLEPGGRVFVVCKDESTAALLREAGEPLNLSLFSPTASPPAGGGSAATVSKPLLPIYEIKRPAAAVVPLPLSSDNRGCSAKQHANPFRIGYADLCYRCSERS